MKHYLLAFACTSVLASFSQKTTISGQIDNPNSNYVTISIPSNEYGKEDTRLDSLVLKEGNFSTSIELDSLTELSLYDGTEYAFFTMKPGEDIDIYINAPIFDESVLFTGTAAKRNNLLSSIMISKELFIANIYSMPSDIPFSDTTRYYEDFENSVSTLNIVLDAGLKSHPEIADQLNLQKNTLVRLMTNFKYRKKFEISMFHLKSSSKGQAFLDFEGEDLEGNTKTLKDFLGKPIIIDFWATWCGPCKAEMPHLKKLEEEFHGKINVLSMNVYDDIDKWKNQATKLGAESSVHLSREKFDKMNQEYLISYIPRFIILDKKGNIVDIHADRPSKNLKSQIEAILE